MNHIETMKQAVDALEMLARYEHPATNIRVRKKDGNSIVTMYPHKIATDAAATLRQAIEQAEKQEPVGWVSEHGIFSAVLLNDLIYSWKPVYTAPPKREWVGLTDEDIQIIEDNTLEGGSFWDVYHAIEAKLKEKNA